MERKDPRGWFGPLRTVAVRGTWYDHFPRVDTPFDKKCFVCQKHYVMGDEGIVLIDGSTCHTRCLLKSIVGFDIDR